MKCEEIQNHIIVDGCGEPDQSKGVWRCIRCGEQFIRKDIVDALEAASFASGEESAIVGMIAAKEAEREARD